jgi:hypothetical protein
LARKLRRGTRFTAHEVAEIRALRRHVGIRRAVAARVRVNVELDALPGRVDELAASVQRIEGENGCFDTELGNLRADAERRAAHNGQFGAEVERLRTEVERLADELDRTRLQAERTERILSSEAWLAAVPRSQSLISVVTPTHDRATLLPRAIASVQAQTHTHWEMIIVDDHSTDETPNVLASLEDPRIRSFSARVRGSISARNQALAAATGEIIVYLDDDNLMLPSWLAAVAWAFDTHPGYDVVYGARVLERERDTLPELHFVPYDRALLERVNFIDTNALAHRRAIEGTTWDTGLQGAADWDLALRLTAARPPLALPVRAALYSTSSPNRITNGPDSPRAVEIVRALHAPRSPEQR